MNRISRALVVGLLASMALGLSLSGCSNAKSLLGSGTSAPSAPTSLSATAGSTSISLTWTAPAGSDGTLIYTVLRGTSAGSEAFLATSLSATNYTDSTITVGTTYYYVVTASNTIGESGVSNEVSATAAKTQFTLYAGIQGSDGHSYVQVFTYDSAANKYAVASGSEYQVDDGTAISADSLRVTSDIDSTHLLLGGGSAISRSFDISNNSVSNSTTFSGLSDLAGVCTLPNGHILATQYGNGHNQVLKEFDSTGGYLRDVYTAANWAVECHAESNTTVYLMDYNGNSDSYSSIAKVAYDGSSWSVTDSFDTTTLVSGNSRYAFVVHTNGKIYMAPQNPDVALGTRQMVVCDKTNLSGSCALFGSDITSGTGIQPATDCDTPQGMVQIPGGNDLLVMSNTCTDGSAVLLRYNISSGGYTLLSPSSGAFPTNISGNGIRFMRIR